MEAFARRLQAIAASPRHEVLVAADPGDDAGLRGMVGAEWRLMIETGEPAEIVAMAAGAA